MWPIAKRNRSVREGSEFSSLAFATSERKEVAFGQCKHTDDPPFCDGTHKTLDILISLSEGSISEMTLSAEGTVGRYKHRDLEVVPRDATVLFAADRMRARAIGSVLVESVRPSGGELNMTGIVTETDLAQKVLTKGVDPPRTTVVPVEVKVVTSPQVDMCLCSAILSPMLEFCLFQIAK